MSKSSLAHASPNIKFSRRERTMPKSNWYCAALAKWPRDRAGYHPAHGRLLGCPAGVPEKLHVTACTSRSFHVVPDAPLPLRGDSCFVVACYWRALMSALWRWCTLITRALSAQGHNGIAWATLDSQKQAAQRSLSSSVPRTLAFTAPPASSPQSSHFSACGQAEKKQQHPSLQHSMLSLAPCRGR